MSDVQTKVSVLGDFIKKRNMEVVELISLTEKQEQELIGVFVDLSPNIHVTPELLDKAVKSQGTHLFTLVDDKGEIIGSATLCVSELPTGSTAHVEAVVVKKEYRGQGLGKMMMEHVIDFARREFPEIAIHLTSNPNRVAANEMYKNIGFQKVETNVYRMEV